MGIATLHLTNAYHPHSGGIRTMYDALLAQAEREGRRMSLVVPGVEDGEKRVSRTTTIYSLRAPRAPAFDRRYRTILPHRFLWPGAGRLWSILDRERPDLVEVQPVTAFVNDPDPLNPRKVPRVQTSPHRFRASPGSHRFWRSGSA
jgi:hypothetical protein